MTVAFCKKCRGRLLRMKAEALKAGDPSRAALLEQSVSLLQGAVADFASLKGDRSADVGECKSLLARTVLEQRRPREAERLAQEAYRILVFPHSKEWLDLVILIGDIDQSRGDSSASLAWYDKVIDSDDGGDWQKNEIKARAHMAKGRALSRLGSSADAAREFEAATAIWTSLEERG